MSTTISTPALKVALWITAGAATVITAGRYVIRYHVRRSFYWDDLAHLLAWILMIGCCAVFQDTFASAEQIQGNPKPPPDAVIAFRKHQEALTMLFILSLWAVKIAFMFLYRMLFWASPIFRRLWWAVMVILIVTVWVPIAGNITGCGPVSKIYDPKSCEAHKKYQQIVLEYVCGVHVGTDFLVMMLPWYIIRKIQISLARKIGLVVIFSVVLITIACDILRTIKSFDEGLFSDSALYTFLEVTLAVIVSCLPIYRALLRDRSKGKLSKPTEEAFVPSTKGTEHRAWVSAGNNKPTEVENGVLGKYARRLSNNVFQNRRRDRQSGTEEQHLASHNMQDLPSAHIVSRNSIEPNSLV